VPLPGVLTIEFRTNSSLPDVANAHRLAQAEVLAHPADNVYIVRVPASTEAAATAAYQQNPRVERAQSFNQRCPLAGSGSSAMTGGPDSPAGVGTSRKGAAQTPAGSDNGVLSTSATPARGQFQEPHDSQPLESSRSFHLGLTLVIATLVGFIAYATFQLRRLRRLSDRVRALLIGMLVLSTAVLYAGQAAVPAVEASFFYVFGQQWYLHMGAYPSVQLQTSGNRGYIYIDNLYSPRDGTGIATTDEDMYIWYGADIRDSIGNKAWWVQVGHGKYAWDNQPFLFAYTDLYVYMGALQNKVICAPGTTPLYGMTPQNAGCSAPLSWAGLGVGIWYQTFIEVGQNNYVVIKINGVELMRVEVAANFGMNIAHAVAELVANYNSPYDLQQKGIFWAGKFVAHDYKVGLGSYQTYPHRLHSGTSLWVPANHAGGFTHIDNRQPEFGGCDYGFRQSAFWYGDRSDSSQHGEVPGHCYDAGDELESPLHAVVYTERQVQRSLEFCTIPYNGEWCKSYTKDGIFARAGTTTWYRVNVLNPSQVSTTDWVQVNVNVDGAAVAIYPQNNVSGAFTERAILDSVESCGNPGGWCFQSFNHSPPPVGGCAYYTVIVYHPNGVADYRAGPIWHCR
jgi:hypothetical protein